ncbi:MAG TPA: hypothetical protein VGR37_24775 [Longimicrobiaceae bacterium]|nr:hypothetical protein [Longimicrobiaceae bacterium]
MTTERDSITLRYLRYLALREGGYVRRGVPGWALRQDIERETKLWIPERLSLLHQRGLLDREDVRAPRLKRPVWIYRINQLGADRAARELELPRRIVLRPLRLAARDTDAAIYIPEGARLALRELRRAMDMRVESLYIADEPGWRSVEELRAQILGDKEEGQGWEPRSRRGPREAAEEEENDEAELRCREPWMGESAGWVDRAVAEGRGEGWDGLYGSMPLPPRERTPGPDDLAWLVRAGLAQKWVVYPGRRGVPIYRITALGGVAIPLEWRDPR